MRSRHSASSFLRSAGSALTCFDGAAFSVVSAADLSVVDLSVADLSVSGDDEALHARPIKLRMVLWEIRHIVS